MKNQLITILSTFLISTAIYKYDTLIDFFSTTQSPVSFKSGEINKAYFDFIRTEYKNESKAHNIKNKNTGRFEPIEAFIFDVKQIDSIIHFNKSLQTGQIPDSIAVYFGKDGNNYEKATRHPNIKMAIIGTQVREGKHYLLNKNINDKPTTRIPGSVSIYDKATPCPVNCPQ